MAGFVGPDEPIQQGFVGPDEPISQGTPAVNPQMNNPQAPYSPTPETGLLGQTITPQGTPLVGKPLEATADYPNARMTDTTIADEQMLEGAGGLGKAAMGLGKDIAAGAPAIKGVLNTLGQYAKRFGQNQAMKALGARSGQIGQVGIPESREIAQSMIDKGVISPLRGPIGLEEKVAELHGAAGQGIGQARALGDVQGTAPQMPEILQNVKQNLEGKYSSGVEKGMSGLNKAREEIAKGGTGTFTGNAQKATELNQAAAANKIYRPQGATTDVADAISHMNNEALKKTLSPADFAKYESHLKDYSNLSKVNEFIKSGERREMTGRGGASLGKTVYDKTMDALGNRVAATMGSKVGDILQSPETPAAIKKMLSAYLLNQNQGMQNTAQ